MTDSPKAQQKRRRLQKLSASLRDNLRRRRSQAKGRRLERAAGEPPGESHDSAGISRDKH
jgi:hypothetical protein